MNEQLYEMICYNIKKTSTRELVRGAYDWLLSLGKEKAIIKKKREKHCV